MCHDLEHKNPCVGKKIEAFSALSRMRLSTVLESAMDLVFSCFVSFFSFIIVCKYITTLVIRFHEMERDLNEWIHFGFLSEMNFLVRLL